jgi:hypothetical protein
MYKRLANIATHRNRGILRLIVFAIPDTNYIKLVDFMALVSTLSQWQKKWIVVFLMPLFLLVGMFVRSQKQQPPLLIFDGHIAEKRRINIGKKINLTRIVPLGKSIARYRCLQNV